MIADLVYHKVAEIRIELISSAYEALCLPLAYPAKYLLY